MALVAISFTSCKKTVVTGDTTSTDSTSVVKDSACVDTTCVDTTKTAK
jgi:hypothetical protein